MRVIGGQFRSRLLQFPKTRLTRPLTDRSKESIFNILGERVLERKVLDLFAGSGSFGIEALSRGASACLFVEHAKIAADCIERNLKSLDLADKCQIIRLDITKALEQAGRGDEKFDLIFLDPPHNKGFIKKVLQQLDPSDIVAPHGIIVIGHSQQEDLPDHFATFQKERQVRIGQSNVSFLVKKEGT